MVLWIKVLHIVAVVSWMAGFLYLPRLYVYHAGVVHGSGEATMLAVMEQRLLRFIMTPAMIAVWVTGPLLGWQMGYLKDGWFHGKLALVVLLTVAHGWLGARRGDFANGTNRFDARFFRIVNEVPTVLMIAIVILVVVKPF